MGSPRRRRPGRGTTVAARRRPCATSSQCRDSRRLVAARGADAQSEREGSSAAARSTPRASSGRDPRRTEDLEAVLGGGRGGQAVVNSEYIVEDVNTFAALSRRRTTVGILS